MSRECADNSHIAGTRDMQDVRRKLPQKVFDSCEVTNEAQIKVVFPIKSKSKAAAGEFYATKGSIPQDLLLFVSAMEQLERKPITARIRFVLAHRIGYTIHFQVCVREQGNANRRVSHSNTSASTQLQLRYLRSAIEGKPQSPAHGLGFGHPQKIEGEGYKPRWLLPERAQRAKHALRIGMMHALVPVP